MRALVLAVLVCLCLPVGTTALAQEAVPEAFRSDFLAELREKAPEARVELTPDGAVVQGQLGESRISLLNAWRRVEAGEDADFVIAQVVDLALMGDVPRYDPARAFVLVRPRPMVVDPFEEAEVDGRPMIRPLAGDLVLVLGQDLGDRFVFLPRSDVGADDVARDEAWDAAAKRTRDSFGDVEVLYGGQGLGFISAREDITASLLMVDAVWDEDLAALVGPAIAVIPLKTLLIVANADDPLAMKELAALMPEVAADPDGMTGFILVRRGGVWGVIAP